MEVKSKKIKTHFGETNPLLIKIKTVVKSKGVQARLPFEISIN